MKNPSQTTISNKSIIHFYFIESLPEQDNILHYLKATGINTGILFNFGKMGKLEWKRFVYSDEKYLKNENIRNTS